MNPDREKICRQVASLFALTTSGVAGEAQAAKDTVKRLVKTHTLTFTEVSPHGNELALKVMRSFWSIPETAPSPTATGERAYNPWDLREPTVEEMIDQLRRAAGFGPSSSSFPFGGYATENPYGNSYGRSNPYGRPRWESTPPLSVLWEGVHVPVTELSSHALRTLIQDFERSHDCVQDLKAKAKDAIYKDDLKEAIALLQSIPGIRCKLTAEMYDGLLEEHKRRSQPRWTGPGWSPR